MKFEQLHLEQSILYEYKVKIPSVVHNGYVSYTDIDVNTCVVRSPTG
jgi:hypothetical protein